MTSVRLTVAIMATPSRADRRAALLEAITPLTAEVIEDVDELGDTWGMYRRCMVEGKRGTHRLVLQDDALPVEGFGLLARALVTKHPDRVLCLYTPALPATFGMQMLQAANQGRDVVDLTRAAMFVPLVATVWPVAAADSCANWYGHTRGPHGRRGRADDARVADWFKSHRPARYPLASVPCLVDHDEDAPSTLANGGRYSRRAALLPSTPAGCLTTG